MSLETSYDPDNIFAKIIRGDIPCAKVFETDEILAFMDAFPQSEGHGLVIHKSARAANILDIDPAPLASVAEGVRRLARATAQALAPDGVRVIQFNGAPAGQSVFHLHFHVIPVYEGRSVGKHGEGAADSEALNLLAEKIRARLD